MKKNSKIILGVIGGLVGIGIIGSSIPEYNNTNNVAIQSAYVSSYQNIQKETNSTENKSVNTTSDVTKNESTTNTVNSTTTTKSTTTNNSSKGTSNTSTTSKSTTSESISTKETKSEMVWVGNTGTKYHREDCRTLKGKGHQITLKQALKEGREPCKVCY